MLRGILFGATVCAASNSMIEVALAPPSSAATFERFGKAEVAMENAGIAGLEKAMTASLARAKLDIDAAIHGSSFLRRSGNEIYVRVLGGPSAQSTAQAEKFEGARSDIEAKRIAQASAEFDALAKLVTAELRSALHGSFLRQNVKVKASDIAWPSTLDLLRDAESNRDALEAGFEGKVLGLQIQFCKALNSYIAKSLGA